MAGLVLLALLGLAARRWLHALVASALLGVGLMHERDGVLRLGFLAVVHDVHSFVRFLGLGCVD